MKAALALSIAAVLLFPAGCGHRKADAKQAALIAAAGKNLPGRSVPSIGAGDRAYGAGDLVRAEEAYGRAIEVEPAAADPHYLRARVRLDLGNIEGTQADLDEALRLAPAHWESKNLLGVLRERQGRSDDAGIAFREASLLAPREMGPRNNLAYLALMEGHVEEAYTLLRTLSQDFPHDARVWNNLALAAENTGRKKEAEDARTAARRADGENR